MRKINKTMPNEIKISESFGFSINRGPEHQGDNGAQISFRPYKLEGEFKIHASFYYTGNVKMFHRSIWLSLEDTVELAKYLNSCLYDHFEKLNLASIKLDAAEQERKNLEFRQRVFGEK